MAAALGQAETAGQSHPGWATLSEDTASWATWFPDTAGFFASVWDEAARAMIYVALAYSLAMALSAVGTVASDFFIGHVEATRHPCPACGRELGDSQEKCAWCEAFLRTGTN